VRVATTLDFGANSIINPDGKIVTFYVKQTDSPSNQLITQAVEIKAGCTVNANIVALYGMIRVAAGTALAPSRLTVYYLADQIYSADYTEWYWNTACNNCALSASITHVDNASCTSGSNGALTARATGGTAPYTYAWSNAQAGYAANNLAVGSYTVTVTDANGLTATANQNVAVQSYVILANTAVSLTNDTIRSGAVGVLGATGTASFSFSTATASNSFVQASAITLTNGSVVSKPVYMASSEVPPTFEANALTSTRNIAVANGVTQTLNALNDTIFNNITLGVGSTIIFSNSRINICGTFTTGANSIIKFTQCAKVKLRNGITLAGGNSFNPDGFDVRVHLTTAASIGAGSTVNATINGLLASSSITTAISLATTPTRMTGQFIAGTVTGNAYTIWNQKTNCSNSCLTPVNARTFEKPLVQSYPNPFADKAYIQYTLPESGKVQLSIFSSSGRMIRALPEQKINGGQEYTYEFDGSGLTEGIYIYRLISSTEVFMGKMILVR